MIELKIAKLIATSLIALLLPVTVHAEQQMPLTIQQTGSAKSFRQWYYSNSAPLDPHPDIRKYKKNEYKYDYLNADRNNFSPNYHQSRLVNTANSIVYRLPSLFFQIEQTALATTSYISYNI